MKLSNRLLLIAALFITCLITANVVAVKLIQLGPLTLPAAVIIFPVSYILGDVLTEVYGYQMMRLVIWLGFLCNLVFVASVWLAQLLPAASFWGWQQAYETILGFTPRLLAASFAGYFAGSFSNSFILSKMKIMTSGRHLWLRTIASTIVGEGLDTVIFIVLAFAGTPLFVPMIIVYHWITKVAIEIVATPLTYLAIGSLKKSEALDTYDLKTNFNPFRL